MVSLAKDKNKQEKLKNNIAAFAVTNADEKIADEILKAIRRA